MAISKNPPCAHRSQVATPILKEEAYVHPLAFVCGDVTLGRRVFVAPFASIRADEGAPFHVGDDSNVQDGVILHALETLHEDGTPVTNNLMEIHGKSYSIYIGNNVSLAHQAQVHGPSIVEDHCFVGMQAFVFRARIGSHCVLEPGCKVMGVTVEDHRYIGMGQIIREQSQADDLPETTEQYPLAHLNDGVVQVNTELARAYGALEDHSV